MKSRNGLLVYINEFLGTWILMFLGNGAVVVAVISGGYDLFGVAILWGFAVTFAIYAAGGVSGAHLNPAVTIPLTIYRKFPVRKVPLYIICQILGAFFATVVLYAVWSGAIVHFEKVNGIIRSAIGATPAESGARSAMIFFTFAPNPAFATANGWGWDTVSPLQWFLSEAVITACLVWWIFALTDEKNPMAPKVAGIAPAIIGGVVAALVAYEAPISMAALNPARDLGPRIFCYFAGWGPVAFPGPRGLWWMPSLSTIVGGIIGGAIYQYLTRPFFLKSSSK
ncbi:MAG TPA: aquaporin family protein [Desulfurococcales archaeon]|nr:aquaporin family protein [Desulfurococcales archaeon]